jgi:hypothetical protein
MVASFTRLSESQLDEIRRFMATYCQRLVELGMPVSEARKVARAVARDRIEKQAKMAQRLDQVRTLTPTYWRSLIELGVPIDEAKPIAEAIAEYDVLATVPTATQKALMQKYCRFLCRAGLWRSPLFVTSNSPNPQKFPFFTPIPASPSHHPKVRNGIKDSVKTPLSV